MLGQLDFKVQNDVQVGVHVSSAMTREEGQAVWLASLISIQHLWSVGCNAESLKVMRDKQRAEAPDSLLEMVLVFSLIILLLALALIYLPAWLS